MIDNKCQLKLKQGELGKEIANELNGGINA